MKLAIAWLTYNSQDLHENMKAQFTKDLKSQVSLYYIDNGSSPKIEENFLSGITLESNSFFSGGWNVAMEQLATEYEYVWMLNDDVEGCSINMGLDMVDTLEQFENGLAITPSFNSPHPIFHNQKRGLRETSWIDWCCPVCSTKNWSKLGGFDEKFLGYGADLDLCKRARLNGLRMFVTDCYELNHLGSTTARREGKIDDMCNVTRMNFLLNEKWGVPDWTRML